MAFDIKQDYGMCIGGVLDGCVTQGGKFYRRDGTEVTADNVPVKPVVINGHGKRTVKQAATEPAVDPQVAEQLKDQ